MKNEVEYKFEVVENIGSRSKECFGEIGTIWKMPRAILIDNRGITWTSRPFEEFSKFLNEIDEYQTKFKLVESYKIDLCKIIGVGELQEFKVANLVADYKIKNNNLMFRNKKTDDWAYSTMYINDFIEFINEHGIEILPKFERLTIDKGDEGYLRAYFEMGYKWINIDYGRGIYISKTSTFSENGAICKYISISEISDRLVKIIKKEYSLEKHFESEGEK